MKRSRHKFGSGPGTFGDNAKAAMNRSRIVAVAAAFMAATALVSLYASKNKVVLLDVDWAGFDLNRAGQKYYDSVKDEFDAAADNYELHPYWSGTDKYIEKPLLPTFSKGLTGKNMLHQMFGARAKWMSEQFEQQGLDGFKIEKDKCVMSSFLTKAGIPQAPLLGPWRTLSDALGGVHDLKAGKFNITFPVVLKACHITQGGQSGVKVIKSRKVFEEKFEDYIDWVERYWVLKAVDAGRAWESSVNRMLNSLEPGLMIVQGFPGPPGSGPYEMKVEVIWGKAYMGFFANPMGPVVDRRCKIYHGIQDMTDTGWIEREAVYGELEWFCMEGHLPAVFELAERVALAAKVDQMRVDVFMSRDDPQHPVVNENSLFSMQGHHEHTQYMGKVWMDGFQSRKRISNDKGPPYSPTRIQPKGNYTIKVN